MSDNKQRFASIDMARGLVMVIMALDHVRDFLHGGKGDIKATVSSPTDMETTYPLLFFTRWITHFCAPTFVFLAGASVYFLSTRRSKKELAGFLVKRGVWLLVLDLLLVSLGWTLRVTSFDLFFSVISAIGAGMILMALLLQLPFSVMLSLGILIVAGHDLIAGLPSIELLRGSFWGDWLYFSGFAMHDLLPAHKMIVIYSILPWTGVLILGYGFGKYFSGLSIAESRSRNLILLGSVVTFLFLLLRLVNVYGDPVPWQVQERGAEITLLSFLNLSKYPPSLLFLFMTLGPILIVIGIFDARTNWLTRVLQIFGRVPLVYYILHIFLIRLICVILFFVQGYGIKEIYQEGDLFAFKPAGFGFSLGVVYMIWILVVVVLYPICKSYDRYKSSHRQWWLNYV